MIPNPSNIPSRTTRGNLVTPFKPLKEEPMLPAHKKLPIRRVVHSSESEPQPAKSDKPAFRRVPLPSKSPLRTTIKSNSSIKKSVLKTPSRVRSKSPLKIKSPGGQRSQSKWGNYSDLLWHYICIWLWFEHIFILFRFLWLKLSQHLSNAMCASIAACTLLL